MNAPQTPTRTLRGLRRRRAAARAVLLVERLWLVLWPPVGVLGAFVVMALLDLPARLPPPREPAAAFGHSGASEGR